MVISQGNTKDKNSVIAATKGSSGGGCGKSCACPKSGRCMAISARK